MKKLSYGKMSLNEVQYKFKLTLNLSCFFTELPSITPSEHLQKFLRSSTPLALFSEKSRSEFIIAPILLEIRELVQQTISIYSGVTLDVAPEEELQGICDFLITQSSPLPIIQAPIIVVVEKSDIEAGFGQCVAEMIAAERINQLRYQSQKKYIYGCVTTGELWQFLRLTESQLDINPQKIYLAEIEKILGAFWTIINE